MGQRRAQERHYVPQLCDNLYGLWLLLPVPQDEEVQSSRAEDDAESSQGVPLLRKKAGIRDAGFIFVGRKGWFVGLVLVIVSGVVLGITILTAVLG